MLKTTSLTMAACLAMVGTAHAGDGNVKPGEAGDAVSIGVSADEISRQTLVGGALDETHLYDAEFKRPALDQEQLDVTMSIDPCEGEGCQKEFQFRLMCQTARGYTQELDSPWYRNYATSGLVRKSFLWQDARLADCEYITEIRVQFRDGWSDESVDSP